MKLKTSTQNGRTISELPAPGRVHDDGIETASFKVITPKGSTLLVDLYFKPGFSPHGWEATKPDTTSVSGYYSTGGLAFDDNTLEDVDGVPTLPACVAVVLRALGYHVSDDFLNAPIE